MNDDLISRQIISDYVQSHIQEINTGYGDLNKHTNEILRMIVAYIETMPPVNPQEPKTEKVIKMRDATPEERESVDKYIKSISKPTGVDFWDLEQEPKTGHWISFGIQGEVDGQIVQTFTCSECDAISIFRMASGNIVNGDLCPNCGCRMFEPQESEVSDADSD